MMALCVVGGAALLAFVLVEPRCVLGPFALTDSTVKAIWLDNVDEMEPVVAVARNYPLVGAWLCSFPLVGLLALGWLVRDRATRHDFGSLVAAAALVAAVIATVGAEKIYAYAMWFAMPIVVVLASRLVASAGWRAAVARVSLALVLGPLTVTATALLVIQSVDAATPPRPGTAERVVCTRNDAYASLARLPAGLVVTDINYGPYVLALTPHAVVAAPYHRITGGMITANTVLNAPLDAARRAAEGDRVTYVAICGRRTSTGTLPAAGSLWAELDAGHVPAWLEQIPGARADQFAVYRVRGMADRPRP
jgi:hypothetical protein